jgi:hypothetical protein
VNVVFVGLIVAGAALSVLSLSSRMVKAISSLSLSGRFTGGNKFVYLTCGIVLIALALGTYFTFYAPSTVTVGSGYINVHFSTLSPIPFIGGDKNVTSSEISTAFVGQVGSGNFSLNKLYGANAGDINIGVYRLGNGATADVASTNSTDLIIQLNSGQYVILGTSNTNALATSFSQNVYPINSP